MINLTIVRTTVRALFGRSRFLLLLPLPVLVVGLAGLMRVALPLNLTSIAPPNGPSRSWWGSGYRWCCRCCR